MGKIFKGHNAKIFIDSLEVGCVSDIILKISEEEEAYFEIENPNVAKIILGKEEITGTLSKAFVSPIRFYISIYLNIFEGLRC